MLMECLSYRSDCLLKAFPRVDDKANCPPLNSRRHCSWYWCQALFIPKRMSEIKHGHPVVRMRQCKSWNSFCTSRAHNLAPGRGVSTVMTAVWNPCDDGSREAENRDEYKESLMEFRTSGWGGQLCHNSCTFHEPWADLWISLSSVNTPLSPRGFLLRHTNHGDDIIAPKSLIILSSFCRSAITEVRLGKAKAKSKQDLTVRNRVFWALTDLAEIKRIKWGFILRHKCEIYIVPPSNLDAFPIPFLSSSLLWLT